MGALKNKNIVLGVTGSIAAYKAAELASRLVKEGANVFPVMTAESLRFIAPLTLASVAHRPALHDLWHESDGGAPAHIALAERADLLLVAPATALILAKFAHGLADDLLSCVYLATTAPVLLSPAMNAHMYAHPATRANVAALVARGHTVIEPETGPLACGAVGKGRLPDIGVIVAAAENIFSK